MITKFPHTISTEKFFTVILSLLIPSYPVICHCVRIHISTNPIKKDFHSRSQQEDNMTVLDFFLCDLLPFKINMVQATRLYNLLCRTCVKSSVVRGPGPVVRRCCPQSLPEPASRRPPTHTSDSAPIDVHPIPTSLQFCVLCTYVCMHIHILGSQCSRVSPVLLT